MLGCVQDVAVRVLGYPVTLGLSVYVGRAGVETAHGVLLRTGVLEEQGEHPCVVCASLHSDCLPLANHSVMACVLHAPHALQMPRSRRTSRWTAPWHRRHPAVLMAILQQPRRATLLPWTSRAIRRQVAIWCCCGWVGAALGHRLSLCLANAEFMMRMFHHSLALALRLQAAWEARRPRPCASDASCS